MPTNSRAWWHEAVVYQIYVRSFADADGDGLGDLAGIRSRLDHLESLGVDVIWLTPFYPSPMADNGYDVSDYEAVDPRFGSEEDLDDLIADIHRRGMKVIIDVVLNHTSIDHPWFVESRSTRSSSRRDWYIWRPPRDGVEPGTPGAEPTNWLGFFAQPTWTYDEESGEYYLHLFTPEQPDLNWENEDVRQALYAMLRHWLARGVDGFRLDVINLISKRYPLQDVPTPHSSHYGDASSQYTCGPRMLEFLDELRDQVFDTAEKPLLTVGEMPGATVEDGLAVTGGERPRLSMIFTFEHMDVDHAPGWGGRYEPRPFDLLALKSTMARWQEGLGRSGWNSLYFGNHDQARVASRFGSRSPAHAVASAKMLATVLHMHRGTPYVYQGDEIGMRNYPFASIEQFADIDAHNSWAYGRALGVPPERLLAGLRQNGRDNARTPMQWDASEHGGFTTGTPWLPLNPNTSEVNVEAQIDDADSVLAHYRRLIELRHSSDIVVFGDYRLLARDHESLYAFERTLGDERWIVVANFSDEELDVAAALGGAVGAAELILGTHHEPPEGAVLQRLRPWEAQICRVLKGSEK